MRAIAVRSVASSIEERLAIDVGDGRDAKEVLVVAVALASECDVDRVVEVVGPLGIQAKAAILR